MTTTSRHNNRLFAAIYERCARSSSFKQEIDPWRARLAAQARGDVLEIGAGGGQNFAFYDPGVTTRVVATEPNAYMRQRAATALAVARVPIEIIAAPAEALPFAAASFDSVLATLVFCSVDDPARALGEVARMLRPTGTLLLFDHGAVRVGGGQRCKISPRRSNAASLAIVTSIAILRRPCAPLVSPSPSWSRAVVAFIPKSPSLPVKPDQRR